MSEDVEARVKAASDQIAAGVQALADITGDHIELAIGIHSVVYYKFYHPASCPEYGKDKPKELPAHDDVPDVFKRMFEDGGTADEPKA